MQRKQQQHVRSPGNDAPVPRDRFKRGAANPDLAIVVVVVVVAVGGSFEIIADDNADGPGSYFFVFCRWTSNGEGMGHIALGPLLSARGNTYWYISVLEIR
jgi:hypothetical protein